MKEYWRKHPIDVYFSGSDGSITENRTFTYFYFPAKDRHSMRVRTSKANFAKFVTAVHLPLTIADNHLTVSFSLCRNRRFPHK